MTDQNIEHLINYIFIAFCLAVGAGLFRGRFVRSDIADEKRPNATANQKTIWDKLIIISKVLASIAALIYAISSIYKLKS